MPFHGRGRGGKRHLQRRFLRKRGAAGMNPLRLTTFASSPEGGAFGYLPVSTDKAPPSGELANAVSLRGFRPLPSSANHLPQRRAFAESGAATAVSLYDPSRENGFQESPQTFLKPEILNDFSAENAQSARGGHSKSSRLVGSAFFARPCRQVCLDFPLKLC